MNKLIYSFFLAFLASFSTYFFTFSYSTLFFSFFVLLIGNFISWMLSDKNNKILVVSLYNTVFCFYLILAINHFLGYQADWSFFTQDWLDEYKFYLKSEENQYLTIWHNFKDSFIDKKYLEYGGYIFYISFLSSIANYYFDGNHLLLQFIGTTIFGALTSIVVFKILNLYIDNQKSFYYALFFMLFSAFNYYSFKLLRDIPIAFFYSCGFYLFLKDRARNKFYDLLCMVFLNFLIWQLRFEHGLFFSLIVVCWFFYTFKNNKLLLMIVGVVFVFFLSFLSLKYLNRAYNTLENYTEFTNVMIEDNEDSFAKHIYKLPAPIKQLGIILNSQVQPFPSWNQVKKSSNIHQMFSGFLQIIYAFFWFFVFVSLLKWVVFERKISVFYDGRFLVLGVICLFFLILNTANMTLRRLIVFYPFIYTVHVLTRERSVSIGNLKKTMFYVLFIYLLLVATYLILKL